MPKKNQRVRIFSALEVANLCGVVNQTAINWIRNGYLKAFTTPGGQYRVYTEDLSQFLQKRGMRLPDELIDETRALLNWNSLAIIDDDESINNLIKTYIEREIPDLSIIQAYDGFEAGHLISEKRPGFIILDIDLPGHDGFQICRRIKTDLEFGNPFVIAITGMDAIDVGEKILALGADAFIAKPLDFTYLLSIIKEYLQKIN